MPPRFAIPIALLGCQEPPAPTVDPGPADTGRVTVDPACVDATATWESFGEGFFTTWCQACHSRTTPQRSGAPEGIDFDTPADLVTWAGAIEQSVLVAESMPLGGGLDEDDRGRLEELLRCGP